MERGMSAIVGWRECDRTMSVIVGWGARNRTMSAIAGWRVCLLGLFRHVNCGDASRVVFPGDISEAGFAHHGS